MRVRIMSASMSRSKKWLNAAAEAAASAVPSVAPSAIRASGQPCAASRRAGTPVTSTSMTMRGFVNSR